MSTDRNYPVDEKQWRRFSEAKFNELIDKITKEYESSLEKIQRLSEKLASFNRDKRIEELEYDLNVLRRRCFHELVGKEMNRYFNFRLRHYDNCKNSGHFIVDLIGSGIGEIVRMTCPVCGETEDITDPAQW